MIIEHVETLYRERAEKRNQWAGNWARASSLGYCPRHLGYQKLGFIGDPLTPRRISVFNHGTIIDGAFKTDLLEALKGSISTEKNRGSIEIEGVKISGECDGLFYLDGRYGVLEGKTMSDFAFDRAKHGEIEEGYQIQAWLYSRMFDVDLIVFYCYRKETSHVVEVVFDGCAKELVITKRFGGDEREIAVNDPMLVAEIRTPFSPEIEAKARATVKAVSAVTCEDDLPPRLTVNDRGEPVIQSETVKAQKKEDKDAALAKYGEPVKVNGGWATYSTGRKIAGFPCSYCPHIRRCLNVRLEFSDSNKPLWVVGNGKETEAA